MAVNERGVRVNDATTASCQTGAQDRDLIGPDDRFTPGSMIELDTGSARYLIRFTQTLERQTGWTWTLFNAVRKLAP